jgi:hypothetical protein
MGKERRHRMSAQQQTSPRRLYLIYIITRPTPSYAVYCSKPLCLTGRLLVFVPF